MRLLKSLGFLLLLLTTTLVQAQYKLVVYYNASQQRPISVTGFNGGLPPWEMDWTGVTHIVHSLNGTNITGTAPFYTQIGSTNDSTEIEYGKISYPGQTTINYRDSLVTIAHRKGIKVLTAVCALGGGASAWNSILADSVLTDQFAYNLKEYCTRKKYDGVELDVEEGSETPAQMTRFARRMKFFLSQLPSGGVFSSAAGGFEATRYPVEVDQYFDYYDLQLYGGSWWSDAAKSNISYPLQPIYKGYTPDAGNFASVWENRSADNNGSMKAWITAGHAKSKMVVGCSVCPRLYVTTDSLYTPINATTQPDMWQYYTYHNSWDARDMLTNGGVEVWDNAKKAGYIKGTAVSNTNNTFFAVNAGQKFITTHFSFQAVDSMVAFIKSQGLGGMMLYCVGNDMRNTMPYGQRTPTIKRAATLTTTVNRPVSITYYPTWCYGATGADLKINPNSGIPWQRLDIVIHFAAPYQSAAPYFGPVQNATDSLNLQYNLPTSGAGQYGNFQDTLIRAAHANGRKVLICWGVIPNGTNIFGDSASVQVAVNTIAAYCQRKGYDGMDIDWEYPDNATNHGRFLRMMKNAFNALNDGKKYLVTTSSVNANTPYNTTNCPVWADPYVDYYLCQMYSLWSVWSSSAGANVYTYNSPLVLNSTNQCAGQDGPYCWANTGPGALAAQGHAKEKIIGGLPSYGYIKTGTTARCTAGGPAQNVNYRLRELEGFITRGGTKQWDALAGQNWLSGTATSAYLGVASGQQFAVSYCDTQAARAHAQWILSQGLGGIFTWDLEEGSMVANGAGTDANHPMEAIVATVFGLGSAPPITPAPTGTFTASVTSLPYPGGSVTLTWTSTNATSASISPTVGSVTISGSTTVNVTATTTYTLTLVGAGGTKTYSVTIAVGAQPVPTGTFNASPTSVSYTGGVVTLTWTSANATSATITPGIGTVAVSGSTTTTVTTTTTFTLTLNGPSGVTSYQTTVTVASPPAPTGTFSALPASLPYTGGNVTLTWSSSNATDATITPGVGIVAPSGTKTVAVTTTTIFTLSLIGNGTTAYTATVTVAAPPVVVNCDTAYNNGYANGYTTGYSVGYASKVCNYDSAYNKGVASVDTMKSYNNGYKAGKASVDTIKVYNNGYNAGKASVNKDSIYAKGKSDGIASVDTTVAYSNGYKAGVASVDTAVYYNRGFSAGYNTGFAKGVASVDTSLYYTHGYNYGYAQGFAACVPETVYVDKPWDNVSYTLVRNQVFPDTAVVLPKGSMITGTSYNSSTHKITISYLKPK